MSSCSRLRCDPAFSSKSARCRSRSRPGRGTPPAAPCPPRLNSASPEAVVDVDGADGLAVQDERRADDTERSFSSPIEALPRKSESSDALSVSRTSPRLHRAPDDGAAHLAGRLAHVLACRCCARPRPSRRLASPSQTKARSALVSSTMASTGDRQHLLQVALARPALLATA